MGKAIRYELEGMKFSISYDELLKTYKKIWNFNYPEFKANLPMIIHYTCIIEYLKEEGHKQTLSDTGLLHGLVHMLHIPDEPIINHQGIIDKFYAHAHPQDLRIFE